MTPRNLWPPITLNIRAIVIGGLLAWLPVIGLVALYLGVRR